jgi:hypothetical protein
MSNSIERENHPSQSAEVDLASSSEISNQKVRLALEKLCLDNDEQRARIAQLQIQWWQKPASLFGLIIPACAFVGFLVNNVKQHEVDQAKIQMKENQLENQRLEFLQKQIAPRVAHLEQAEQKLIDNTFRHYTDICEIGGRIAAAESVNAAQLVFEDFGTILTVDSGIDNAIKEIDDCLNEWGKDQISMELAKVRKDASVLNLSYTCRATFQKKYAAQFPQAVRNLTISIYREAIDVAKDLKTSTDRKEATAAIGQFLKLYYGKLVLVESNNVSSAMVKVNQELSTWTSGRPKRGTFDGLLKILKKEADQLASQKTEDLKNLKSAVDPEEVVKE